MRHTTETLSRALQVAKQIELLEEELTKILSPESKPATVLSPAKWRAIRKAQAARWKGTGTPKRKVFKLPAKTRANMKASAQKRWAKVRENAK